jgi:multidrug resistance efflux pump
MKGMRGEGIKGLSILNRRPATRGWRVSIRVALASCLALFGCDNSQTEHEQLELSSIVPVVEVRRIERGRIDSRVSVVGTLIPIQATTVVSDVDGIIKELLPSQESISMELNGQVREFPLGFDIGCPVKAGQPLLQIDPIDFELSVKQAEANLELARMQLANLKAWRRDEEIERLNGLVGEAQAAYDQAESELNRTKQLVAQQAVADSEYDAAIMAYHRTKAVLLQARSQLKIAEAGPTAEELAVAQAQVRTAEASLEVAEEKLEKTTIRAPYDGVVADRFVDVGDRVTAMPRVEIMQIINPAVLFAQVAIPEEYQGVVKVNTQAEIHAVGLGKSHVGLVDLVNSKIDPETRTFRARVTIDNRQGQLKPGGFVRVEIPILSARNSIVIQRNQVSFDEGRPVVYVYKDGRVEQRQLKLGISDAERQTYQVESGVEVGEQIAVTNLHLLSDGVEVTVKGERGEGGEGQRSGGREGQRGEGAEGISSRPATKGRESTEHTHGNLNFLAADRAVPRSASKEVVR